MSELAFTVMGVPVTQGSKKAFVNNFGAHVVESGGVRLRSWRDSVAREAALARQLADWDTVDGPVGVTITFLLERPTSYPRRIRYPWKSADLDKLVRAILDSCTTAKVWRDDSRVVDLVAVKRFAVDHLGARIVVRTLDEPEIPRGKVRTPVQLQLVELPDIVDMPTGGRL